MDVLRDLKLFQRIEVLWIKDRIILQPHPTKEQIGYAVFHQPLQGFLRYRYLCFLQFLPAERYYRRGILLCCGHHGDWQHRFCGVEFLLQHMQQRPMIAGFHIPERYRDGVCPLVGVLDVE